MGRRKVKPDLANVGINPLCNELVVKVNKKAHDVINKFGNADHLEFTLESTPFCKLFEVTGCKKNMLDLPIRAKELLLFVMYSIDSGTDVLWIDRREYMKATGIKSPNTFRDAVAALSNALYIYPHGSIKDVFWINPHFFFKGDRIKKYPNNVRK